MSFSYDNFIRPLTSSDRVLKIYGDDGIVVYTINPFSVKTISVYANNIRINLHTDRLITINFSSNNEAKMAIGKLRTALDVLQNKEPLFISKEIQEYVKNNVFGPTGSTGSTGDQGPQGDIGHSAYDIWLEQGNIGTVDTFFLSISGTSGLADRYNGTSSNEIVIPSQGTVISFDTQTELAFVPGQHVYLYNDLSTNFYLIDDYVEDLTSVYILGEVDAYDRVTGSMSIVTIESQPIGGTYSTWYLALTGQQGQTGMTGSDGTQGTSGTSGTSGRSGFGSLSTWNSSETPDVSGNFAIGSDITNTYFDINSIDIYGVDQTTMLNAIIAMITSGQPIVFNITDGSLLVSFYVETGSLGLQYYSFSGKTISSVTLPGPNPYMVSYNIAFNGTSGSAGTSGTEGTSGTSGTEGTSGTSGLTGSDGVSGTSGTSGTAGSAGTSGSMGTAGTSGTTPTVDLTLSGNLDVSGTASFNGLSVLGETSEILNNYGATASNVTYDFNTGAIWYHGTASTNYTANFTNLPTTNNRALTATILINQGPTGYLPTSLQIGGVSKTIKWSGGTYSASTNKVDVVGFTFIRTNSDWAQILGQVSSFS